MDMSKIIEYLSVIKNKKHNFSQFLVPYLCHNSSKPYDGIFFLLIKISIQFKFIPKTYSPPILNLFNTVILFKDGNQIFLMQPLSLSIFY